jgi:hypothetical protein
MTRLREHMGGESYRVELIALPDDNYPVAVRLRRALKTLLRAYGLRCVSIQETTPWPAGAAGVTLEQEDDDDEIGHQ